MVTFPLQAACETQLDFFFIVENSSEGPKTQTVISGNKLPADDG